MPQHYSEQEQSSISQNGFTSQVFIIASQVIKNIDVCIDQNADDKAEWCIRLATQWCFPMHKLTQRLTQLKFFSPFSVYLNLHLSPTGCWRCPHLHSVGKTHWILTSLDKISGCPRGSLRCRDWAQNPVSNPLSPVNGNHHPYVDWQIKPRSVFFTNSQGCKMPPRHVCLRTIALA